MRFYEIKANKKYFIICKEQPSGGGFAHVVKLCDDNGTTISSAKKRYNGRTWERYPYESAIIQAVSRCEILTEQQKSEIIQEAEKINFSYKYIDFLDI